MSSPAKKFVEQLFNDAVVQDASDIHFYPFPQKKEVHIYYRILGKRFFIRSIPFDSFEMILTHLKFSAGMDIGEERQPQSGTLQFESNDQRRYSLRLSTLPVARSESMTIRLLLQEQDFPLEQLFLFPFQAEQMKQLLTNFGLYLFTGPTGSGKSTTMYALVEALLQKSTYQVITLEDPVEKRIEHALQVEINETAGITYQTGLKAALRHDPDVLLIGEIRDQETALFAIRAALTGHLVLSTLHAKNATSTLERLLDLGVNEKELHQTLKAICALQLLPIQINGITARRAAIVELLQGDSVQQLLHDEKNVQFHTFHDLRKKAYLYGYITQEIYDEFNV